MLHILSIDDGSSDASEQEQKPVWGEIEQRFYDWLVAHPDEAAEARKPKSLGEALDTVLDGLARRGGFTQHDRFRLRGGLDAADAADAAMTSRDRADEALGQISRGMRVTGGMNNAYEAQNDEHWITFGDA